MVPNLILSILYLREDVADPLTISALLVDRVLQITTAFVFPISLLVVLIAPVRIARVGAVVGSICSALLGGSATVSALRPPREIFTTILAIVCLAIGLTLLGWLTRNVLLPLRWRRVALIGILVALLPFIQFWHETSFVPARLNTSLSMTPIDITLDSETESNRRVTLQFELVNGSGIDAVILASQVMWCFRAPDAGLSRMDELYNDPQCRWAGLIDETSVIGGKTSFSYHQAFSGPKDLPLLQLYVQVWYARGDRLRIGPEVQVDSSAIACSADHFATYQILDEAKFKGLVQKERYITFESSLGKTSSEGVDGQHPGFYPTGFYMTAEREPLCGIGRDDLANYLGVKFSNSIQQAWVPTK
jgi:hypothetical protein